MRVLKNELMSRHTTFKVGGPADIFINPESIDELIQIIADLKSRDEKYYIVGNGSNLLVSDEGIRGTVIEISSYISGINIKEESDDGSVCICAEAGAMLSKIAGFALKNGLTGLEFASGIPGTLGGAVYMNAGAYDGEISGVLGNTFYYDTMCEKTLVLDNIGHNFAYRKSIFQENSGIILKSTIKLQKGQDILIRSKMEDFANRRKSKQPLEYPSAGSTFKRPAGYFAGKLIEDAGLRGYRIGGAQVSEKHCGFIINRGDATASDILSLIEFVKQKVLKQFGVELKEEVRII